jgi:hypothetical protein
VTLYRNLEGQLVLSQSSGSAQLPFIDAILYISLTLRFSSSFSIPGVIDAKVVLPVIAHNSKNLMFSLLETLSVKAAQSGSMLKNVPFCIRRIKEFTPLRLVYSQSLPLVSPPERWISWIPAVKWL